MKKMRNFMMVIAVMMVLVVALSDKIAIKRDMVLGKILNNEVETVETTEETKELETVILFRGGNGTFLCYQVLYSNGEYETVFGLNQLVNSLNENTDDLYVQTETGKIQRIDSESKKIYDIKIAHATADDL